MKNLFIKFFAVLLSVVFLFCFGCDNKNKNPDLNNESENSETAEEENVGSSKIAQVSPTEGGTVNLLYGEVANWCLNYPSDSLTDKFYIAENRFVHNGNSEQVKEEIKNDFSNEIVNKISSDTLFYPESVNIVFSCSEPASEYVVKLALDNKFTVNLQEKTVTETSAKFEDLFVNKTYYWKVVAKYDGGREEVSKWFTFNTAKTIRTIKIDGVSNTRDIGGANTVAFAKVNVPGQLKQGMIYRMASPDGLTEQGKSDIIKYGIKTHLDLRRSGEYKAMNVSGMTDKQINTAGGVSFQGEEELSYKYKIPGEYKNPILKEEIEWFADESHYPVIFNCLAGRDRTGCLAFLLEALCGVPEKQLKEDYEFGCFSRFGSNWGNVYESSAQNAGVRSCVDQAYDYINSLHPTKPVFADKVYSFLRDAGVSANDLDKIIEIMVEH